MENEFFKTVRDSVKHWYLPLIIGLIFIALGIYTFSAPAESYLALSILFSITFISSGILEIVFSIANRKEMDNWGWTLIFGIITLVMGFLLMANPQLSMITLPLYVGFLILFRSISAIAYSIDLKNYQVMDWGNLLVIGILGVLFSFILIWNPGIGGMTLVFWTGLALIASGIYSVYLAFKLKKLKNMDANEIEKELEVAK